MYDLQLVVAVVDDDPAIRRLLKKVAADCGDAFIEAATVSEGEVLLREYPWDIAVIDRRLPDGDGLDLCRAVSALIRDGESHRHILFLSSVGSQDERIRGFDAGADDYVCKPAAPQELMARLRAIRRTVLVQKALLARVATLEQMSVIDGLTEVYNHRFFESSARRLFEIAMRHQRPLAVAMVDLDFFKRINDEYGHQSGDLVLTLVSTALAQALRSSDILARYGGEEFAVLLPETTLIEASALAERMRAAVESLRIALRGGEVSITVSIGVAALPLPDTDTAARFVDAADQSLYAAKSCGRNCVRLYGVSVETASADRSPTRELRIVN